MFLNDAKQELQKTFDLEWRTVQKTTFCLNEGRQNACEHLTRIFFSEV